MMFRYFRLEGLAFSFNGGKDCVVLLHIIRVALSNLNSRYGDRKTNYYKCINLPIIWMKRDNEFDELTSFLHSCVNKYNFQLFDTCSDYKHGLELYLETFNSNCKGIFMGQRRDDPYCNKLNLQTHCSEGWPDMIRINPILDWSFHDVWKFLKIYNIEYCKLYDEGYTSLGASVATIPNPLLYNPKTGKYNAAFTLKYDKAERFGRVIGLYSKTKRSLNANENEFKIFVLLHGNDTFWNKTKQVKC